MNEKQTNSVGFRGKTKNLGIKLAKTACIMLWLLFLSSYTVLAQEITVNGTVSGADGVGIPGVSVVVKGETTKGTTTDPDGKYTIALNQGKTLVFSFVGMKTQEVVANSTSVDVVMEEDLLNLDEVVVIAYGTAKKSAFTGAASQINSDEMKERPITHFAQAIEGTSGVQVAASTGQPGSAPDIRVRGTGSFNLSNDPLYVVDGMIYLGFTNAINPNDIESISVLKDAAATALYGNKAANGVVVITTKKGRDGKGQLTVDVSTGFSTRAFPEYEKVGVEDYYVLMWEAIKNDRLYNNSDTEAAANLYASNNLINRLGYNVLNVADDQIVTDGVFNPNASILPGYSDLNWQDELENNGNYKNYNVSYSGGNKKTDYFVSLGYLSDEGFVIESNFKRITGRANINHQAKDWFKTGLNIAGTSTETNYTSDGATSVRNPYNTIRTMGPIYPVYAHDPVTGDFILEDGKKVYDLNDHRPSGAGSGRHVLAEMQWDTDLREVTSLNAKSYGEITFLKDFKFTVNAGLEERHFYRTLYYNTIIGDGAPAGYGYRAYTRRNLWTFNELLTYNKSFDFGDIDILAGHESQQMNYTEMTGSKRDQIIAGNEELINFVTNDGLDGYQDNYTTEGYFARINYNYLKKYFVSGSYRADASSKLHPDYRWGNFWSFSAAWKLDQESFIKNLGWFDMLKLRASYGETGNDQGLGYYAYQSLYELGHNNLGEAGMIQNATLASRRLQWESMNTIDFGLEFALFNRLTGTIGYYNKMTYDVILDVPVPYSSGGDQIPENIGLMSNKGFEIELGLDAIKNNNIHWKVDANLSTNKNEIIEMPQDEIINGTKKWMEGHSIYDYWLKDYYGVDPADGMVVYIADDSSQPDVRIVGTDTLTTNSNNARYHYAGSSLPDFQGALANTFTYKNFDLKLIVTFSVGGKVYDGAYAGIMDGGDFGNAMSTDMLNRWQQPGDITDVPRMDPTNNGIFNTTSDRWLVDASYLSVKSLALGYTIPTRYTDYIGITNAKIYASAENLFFFNHRKGMMGNQQYSGITSSVYPSRRMFIIGLNVNF